MARRRDGGETFRLTADILLRAYAAGIFPMAEDADDATIHWIDPTQRGVLPLDGFHVSRSLRKTLKREPFRIGVDTAFPAVLDACAEPAPGRERTWINAEIRDLYIDLHRMGHAHCVEAWDGDDLVGGLYGVRLGGAFFGESMFSRRTDASKIALVYLWDRLMRGGFALLDTQFITSHLATFGAVEIERRTYRERLDAALVADADFYPAGAGTLESVLQSLSQTS